MISDLHTSNCFNARNHTDTMLTRFVVDFESTACERVYVRWYRARKAKFCKYSTQWYVHIDTDTNKYGKRINRVAHAFKTLTQTQAQAQAQAPTAAESLAMEK